MVAVVVGAAVGLAATSISTPVRLVAILVAAAAVDLVVAEAEVVPAVDEVSVAVRDNFV